MWEAIAWGNTALRNMKIAVIFMFMLGCLWWDQEEFLFLKRLQHQNGR